MKNPRYLYLYGGAIGDGLLGIHLGRVLCANVPGAKLLLLSTRPNRFMKELAAPIPFLEYQELVKTNFKSWPTLFRYISTPWKTAVYEPATAHVPLWWKLILWWTSRRKGSTEVRMQMQHHEQKTPARARVFTFSGPDDDLFETVTKVLSGWDIPLKVTPKPTLTAPENGVPPSQSTYIVFHFFAGNYRRSIPVDHARDLLQQARKLYPHHHFFITCAGEEAARAPRMVEGIERAEVKKNVPAQELLTLLKNASLVVGTASGVIHMSAQLDVPTVALCNLFDPCWLPRYNPRVTLISARENCRCKGDKTGDCGIETPEGTVFRCLYDIKTERIIEAMKEKLAP